MLGDYHEFFETYWRKRPLYVENAGVEYAESYKVGQFLADVAATQPRPYLAVATQEGTRVFKKCVSVEELRQAVEHGSVSAIKASKLWHQRMPESWTWMRMLFGSLCRAVAMMYMSSSKSEDVDIFLAGPNSSLGTHFDTTDVFTLQICGERKWEIDEEVKLDRVLTIAGNPEWFPAKEIEFQSPTREFTLRPGDTLYVPAYGVHRVTGVSWSISLSLGLRAFNEIDYVEHLLEGIRLTRYLSYPPVRSFPALCEEDHAIAKEELLRRVRALLYQIESVAFANLLIPLHLPSDLNPSVTENIRHEPTPDLLGMFRSGFALDKDKE